MKRQKNEEAARVRILKVVSVFSVNRLLGSPPVSEEEGVPGCVYGAWRRFKVASVGKWERGLTWGATRHDRHTV